jgi:hypothetical protein
MRASSGSLESGKGIRDAGRRLGANRSATVFIRTPGWSRVSGEEVWERVKLLCVAAIVPPRRRIAYVLVTGV